MASGRVCTGYSLPYVAKYVNTSGTISYSNGMKLARGVDVNISPSASSSTKFYVDNTSGESAAGIFTGGTVTLTVDGLKLNAEKLIMGLGTADSDGFTHYNDSTQPPYVGIGFVARYMEDGVTSYQAYILCKTVFDPVGTSAKTQGETIEFQTQSLTAQILRSDDSVHTWKLIGEEQTTEALAEADIKGYFGITP